MIDGGLLDGLGESDRALFELARQQIPLAELAVRLGVPVGDAARRVDDLTARLLLPDRAALQRWPMALPREAAFPQQAATGTSSPGTPPPPEPRPRPRLRNRRAFLGFAAVTGAAAAGSVAALALRGGGGRPLPKLSARPSPSPTSPAPGALASLVPVPAAFEWRHFAAAERIDWPVGVFFLSWLDGSIEGWRLTGPAAGKEPLNAIFRIADDNQAVFANAAGVPFLLHRASGRTWTWDPGLLGLAAMSDGRFVFQRAKGPPGDAYPEYAGDFTIVDAAGKTVSTFQFPAGGRAPAPMLFSRDGSALVAAGGNTSWSDYRQLFLVDTATGSLREVGSLPDPPAGYSAVAPQFAMVEAPAAWTVAVSYSPGPGTPQPPPADLYRGFVRTYAWDGTLRSEAPAAWGGDVSPNGRYVISTAFMRMVVGEEDAVGGEYWPAVIVSDTASGAPVFRVRSATLAYGDNLGGSRWLPDSSGFVVQTGPLVLPPSGPSGQLTRPTYAVVDVGSQSVTALPFSAGDWWAGPVPSPFTPGVFALGHTAVATLGNPAAAFRANGPGKFAGHIAPWGRDGGEVRFALPEGGHGLGGSPILLAPAIDHAPFDDTLRLQVANTGDCLNLRDQPSLSSRSVACLPDGMSLLVTPPATAPIPGTRRLLAAISSPSGTWIRVRAAAGAEGWAFADYLRWA